MVRSAFPMKTDAPKKLVGAFVDIADAHQFALVSLITGESKSVILNELLSDYLSRQPNTDSLVKEAAKQSINVWHKNGWCGRKTNKAFQTFVVNTKKDLEKHRIPDTLIALILKEISSAIKSDKK